jgi:hypothetical protein
LRILQKQADSWSIKRARRIAITPTKESRIVILKFTRIAVAIHHEIQLHNIKAELLVRIDMLGVMRPIRHLAYDDERNRLVTTHYDDTPGGDIASWPLEIGLKPTKMSLPNFCPRGTFHVNNYTIR